jgi:hypothetical protein
MKYVDRTTEEILRKVLDAAIKGNAESFDRQLAAFPTDDSLNAASARARNVVGVIILEQYEAAPTPEMVTKLAGFVALSSEDWSGIGAADFATFITSLFTDESVEHDLPATVATRIHFVLAAYLLVQFKKPSETAFDHLDRLWEKLTYRNWMAAFRKAAADSPLVDLRKGIQDAWQWASRKALDTTPVEPKFASVSGITDELEISKALLVKAKDSIDGAARQTKFMVARVESLELGAPAKGLHELSSQIEVMEGQIAALIAGIGDLVTAAEDVRKL